MQKVYLLLRNNQKTGPYSLDELLQLQLKSFDLVWVEGKSAGWRYPGEIESLKPYMADVPKPSSTLEPIPTAAIEKEILIQPSSASQSKKVFVSMPGKPRPVYKPMEEEQPAPRSASNEPEFQTAAEPISRYAPGYVAPPREDVQTKYARPVNDVEDDYTRWIVQNRRKKKPMFTSKNLLVALLISVVGFGGYYYFKSPSASVTPVQILADTQTATTQDDVGATEKAGIVQAADQPATKQSSRKKSASKTTTKAVATTTKETTAKNKVATTVDHVTEKAVMSKPNTDEGNAVAQEETRSKPIEETQPKEKKKKLGEVIKGIFSKKDKKSEKTETVLEEPKPATNRESQHRTDDAPAGKESPSATANVDISDQIDLTSNAPDNWMMGVKGLKITLHNRSSLPIQSASVTVFYYDENNKTLDKKSISFNNVTGKGKLTLAAPDHKWADHVDFKLGDVILKEDRYAQN